jgi:hypothetical protein
MATFKPPANKASEHDDHGSPSADTTDRFHTDALLRHAGFRIHSRPRVGPAVWSFRGALMTYTEAVAQMKWQRARATPHESAPV